MFDRPRCVALWLLGVFSALTTSAWAGSGPERTLLVVNGRSPLSLRVASEYAALREIPDRHLLILMNAPGESIAGQATAPFADVWDGILQPILDHLDREDLLVEIEQIVYSTGFPPMIDIREIADAHGASGASTASLTGATYHLHEIRRGAASWLKLSANQYFRGGSPNDSSLVRTLTDDETELQNEAYRAYTAKEHSISVDCYAKLLETYQDGNTFYNYACSLALIGLRTQAMDALEKATAHGFSDPFWARNDKDLRELRTEPRFEGIVRAMAREPVIFPTRGFRSAAVWSRRIEPEAMSIYSAIDAEGGGYYLSSMLGFSGRNGNTEAEILQVVQSGAACDGTRPDGTVYLVRSRDQRSRARSAYLEATKAELDALGARTELLQVARDEPPFPVGARDIIGTITGAADIDLLGSESRTLPGAILDNLTEYGAAFWHDEEVKATEFASFGAVMTSGPVTKGGVLQPKAMHPRVHVYYRHGCTAAESVYQSVYAPYQLLVLGDALAAPYAERAEVLVKGMPEVWKGTMEIDPQGLPSGERGFARWELYADGWLVAECNGVGRLSVDTTKLPDGVLQGRLVAVDETAVATRSGTSFEMLVDNGGHRVSCSAANASVDSNDSVILRGTADSALEVMIHRGAHVVATVKPADDGTYEAIVPARALGPGTARLHARARFDAPPLAVSAGLDVQVTMPEQKAVAEDGWARRGLAGTARQGRNEATFVLDGLSPGCVWQLFDACSQVGGAAGTTLTLEGEFHVDGDGLQEITVYTSLGAKLEVHDNVVLDVPAGSGSMHAVTVHLAAGWHPMRWTLTTPEGLYHFQAQVSGATTPGFFGADRLRHRVEGMRLVDADMSLTLADSYAESSLQDGVCGGAAQRIPSGELICSWKKYQRDIQGVLLYANPVDWNEGEEPAPFPMEWVVEKKSGRSSWSKVGRVTVEFGWDPARGAREQGAVPSCIALSFPSTSARELRVRPVVESPAVALTEVEVFQKGKRR